AAADGGSDDARPSCTGTCDDYIQSLRLAIESATQAACVRRPLSPVLACAPNGNSPDNCPSDTRDATRALEPQIRDYLAAPCPQIAGDAVSFDGCPCHFN